MIIMAGVKNDMLHFFTVFFILLTSFPRDKRLVMPLDDDYDDEDSARLFERHEVSEANISEWRVILEQKSLSFLPSFLWGWKSNSCCFLSSLLLPLLSPFWFYYTSSVGVYLFLFAWQDKQLRLLATLDDDNSWDDNE